MSPSGKEGPFEVVYSEAVALALRELIERAGDENLEAEVLAAYEIADAALHVRAKMNLRNRCMTSRGMKLQMRLAVVATADNRLCRASRKAACLPPLVSIVDDFR